MVIDMFCNATVAPSITGTESNTQLNIMTTLLAWEIIFCGLITYCRSVQNLSQWQRSVLQSLGAHMSRASHMLRQSISLDSWSASAGNERVAEVVKVAQAFNMLAADTAPNTNGTITNNNLPSTDVRWGPARISKFETFSRRRHTTLSTRKWIVYKMRRSSKLKVSGNGRETFPYIDK